MQVFRNLKMNLVFSGEEVFLSGDISVPLTNTGIPSHINSFPHPATWQVEVMRYFEEEKRMYCQVLAYHTGNLGFLPSQDRIPFVGKVERITFARIHTSRLMECVMGEEGKLALINRNIERAQQWKIEEPAAADPVEIPLPEIPIPIPIPPPPPPPRDVIREIYRSYTVPIKDLRFRFGGVSFEKFLKETNQMEEILVENHVIREEFDAVKNYFSNVLKTKRISVNARITLKNGMVDEIHAKSPEIEKISNEVIDSVKFELVNDMGKKRFWAETERNLFTADDMLDEFLNRKGRQNPFFANDQELFEHLLSIKSTKHYKHLRYLSSLHAHNVMRLRFVIRPFSFVFLLEGKQCYHIVWETLDTAEATYIWQAEKEKSKLKLQLRKVEDIINTVKVQGKTAYINSARDEQYRRIMHDYSDPLQGFIRWKGELDACII